MDINEKYDWYTKLVEYNAKALNSLSLLRTNTKSVQIEDNQIIKTFFEATDNIREMANCCAKLSPSSKKKLLLKKIKEVEEKTLSTIGALQLAMDLGYTGSGVSEEMEEELFAKVETLTQNMQNPSNERFRLENAETLHDLIRYFHQKGVNAMFDVKNLDEADGDILVRTHMKDGSTIKLIDLEGKLRNTNLKKLNLQELDYKPLKAVLELYTSKGFKKPGSEDFKAVVSKEKLVTQIEMGCHYSELEAQIGSKNSIKFFFRDTPFGSYPNARYRSKYVRAVLIKLGFEIESKRNETKAKWTGKSEQKAYDTLKEVVRLVASTRDLDMGDSFIDEYPNKAVNAFLEGNTDIGSYLHKCHKERRKDDTKIK